MRSGSDSDAWSLNFQLGTCYLSKGDIRTAERYVRRSVALASTPEEHSISALRLSECLAKKAVSVPQR
jgi:hypothetical protein